MRSNRHSGLRFVFLKKIMVIVLLFSILLKIVTGSPAFIVVSFLIASLLYFISFWHKSRVTYYIIYFICITYVLFSGLYHVNSEDKNYFLYLIYITLSVQLSLIIRKLNFDYQSSKFMLVMALSWTVYHIFNIGYNPDAYNDLLDGSRNYISAHLIIFLAYYIFSCKKLQKNVNLFYPILVVICCFFLFGRSGIALSIFLLFIAMSQKTTMIKLFLFVVVVFTSYFYQFELMTIFSNSNFSNGVESERSIMLSEYIFGASKDWRGFLFGVDFKSCCETIVAFKVNPHNSFINLHSRFGILPFILGFILYVHMFLKNKVTHNMTVNVLILVVFARYFADSIGFFGIVDFILVSMFVYVILDSKECDKNYIFPRVGTREGDVK